MKIIYLKQFIFFILFSIVLVSCNIQSKKGAWSKADKIRFYQEMEKTKELDNLGEDKKKWIDCYFEKAQAEFSSYDDADNDLEGCKKLAEICGNEIIDQGSEIGKWSERDKKLYFDEMNKTDFSSLGDLKNDYINCYLNKLEKNFQSIRIANLDTLKCEALALECASELLPAN